MPVDVEDCGDAAIVDIVYLLNRLEARLARFSDDLSASKDGLDAIPEEVPIESLSTALPLPEAERGMTSDNGAASKCSTGSAGAGGTGTGAVADAVASAGTALEREGVPGLRLFAKFEGVAGRFAMAEVDWDLDNVGCGGSGGLLEGNDASLECVAYPARSMGCLLAGDERALDTETVGSADCLCFSGSGTTADAGTDIVWLCPGLL